MKQANKIRYDVSYTVNSENIRQTQKLFDIFSNLEDMMRKVEEALNGLRILFNLPEKEIDITVRLTQESLVIYSDNSSVSTIEFDTQTDNVDDLQAYIESALFYGLFYIIKNLPEEASKAAINRSFRQGLDEGMSEAVD